MKCSEQSDASDLKIEIVATEDVFSVAVLLV